MKILLTLTGILLFACASAPSRPTLYLLREASPEAGAVPVSQKVGLGSVVLAPYLDQPGIVLETAPAQMRVANQHQWAEPLKAGVRALLRTRLSEALDLEVGSSRALHWDAEVNVHVEQLHGTMDGSALMVASYRIQRRSGAPAVTQYRLTQRVALEDAGYASLVAAEAKLIDDLAVAIARSLQELGAI